MPPLDDLQGGGGRLPEPLACGLARRGFTMTSPMTGLTLAVPDGAGVPVIPTDPAGPLAGTTSPIQPRTATDGAAELTAPLRGPCGAADAGIPPATVEAAAEKARAAGKTAEIVGVAGAARPSASPAPRRPPSAGPAAARR
jgi:hypothetical protein